ncbi:unnamed protein product [Boreogadus saida]
MLLKGATFVDSTALESARAEVMGPRDGVERSLEPGKDAGTSMRPGAVAVDPLEPGKEGETTLRPLVHGRTLAFHISCGTSRFHQKLLAPPQRYARIL